MSRAPPFMGDILWAHLEILQKDVEKDRSNIENVPSNFSDNSYNNENNNAYSRTYTQLESSNNQTNVVSSQSIGNNSNVSHRYTNAPSSQRISNGGSASYVPPEYAGSNADSSSEYSYHGMDNANNSMKYTQQQILTGRVPQYPPPPSHMGGYGDQFGTTEWVCPPVTYAPPLIPSSHPPPGGDSWHQPADYQPVTSSNSLSIPGMHQHPAFLQVCIFGFIYFY